MVDRLRKFPICIPFHQIPGNTDINNRRVANVESCFGSSGQPLQSPDRVLIGEGVLMKMCRKKAKPRQFFLFNDLLVYGSIVLSKRRYSRQHVVPLEEIKVEDVEDDGDSKFGFLIKTRHKSFMVYAVSESEKEQWMTHICRCVENLLRHGRQAATDHAAVWIPDAEAENCMCCRNVRFSFVQRKHHCRACGSVVCGKCSSKNFVLEGISKTPVRVCDLCYNKLCQGITATAQSRSTVVHPINVDTSSDEEEEHVYANQEPATFYPNQDATNRVEKLI
ncbi:hypothetical protein M3Y98_00793800 [Aphelenchoides besseyi]|nr:hypothetical protein M3Y98_00793800 [Aphelenchoides besseyi]